MSNYFDCGEKKIGWITEHPRGICFYCDCCNNHHYEGGSYKAYYSFGCKLDKILCHECYKYTGHNCEYCNPVEEN